VNVQPMTVPLAHQLFLVFWAAGALDQALRFSEFCYELDPNRPSFREALCSSWLATGSEHWNSAWRVLTESQTRARPDQNPQTVPIWGGQKLGNKKLLVYQEQGFGDALLAMRLLPILAARGFRFDLWVFPQIADLAKAFGSFDRFVASDTRPDPAALGYAYAAPLFGLIHALYLTPEEVKTPPVVRAAPEQARALRDRVRSLAGVRIGLAYGGNPDRRDDWLRSIPLEALRGLAALPGISWVNLMMDSRPDKSQAMETFRMFDPMPEVKSFADTAAVIEELDAVVAVDCSVAHVAGNLAKPLWVLAPPSADWRWQVGQDTKPWWPTARLLRSNGPGLWEQPLQTLLSEVGDFVHKSK